MPASAVSSSLCRPDLAWMPHPGRTAPWRRSCIWLWTIRTPTCARPPMPCVISCWPMLRSSTSWWRSPARPIQGGKIWLTVMEQATAGSSRCVTGAHQRACCISYAMSIVALRVRRLIAQRGLSVDLIHAHKLCYEGIAGYLLSRWLAVPLVCSVRGDAERLALRVLPHYQPIFRAVAQRCRRLYYVSAWIRPQIERRLKAPPRSGGAP